MIVAIYSAKGGVGKTTLSVNLAAASASLARKTLLWDLDAQGAATFILGGDEQAERNSAREGITGEGDATRLIRPSRLPRLDLLPADNSLRDLDRAFHELGKRRRLARVADKFLGAYDRVIIDCPPGLTETSEQILRAADLVVVPVIPAALSRRALDTVKQYLAGKKGSKVILAPVFSMVDRRRSLHRAELAAHPGWPVIPMASVYERMSEERMAVSELLPRSAPPVDAVFGLWRRIEKALASISD